MKNSMLVLSVIVLLSACSSPKYAYNFDYHDYNAGKKKASVATSGGLSVDPATLVASTSNTPTVFDEPVTTVSTEAAAAPVMTRKSFKAFKAELKKEVKEMKVMKKTGKVLSATKAAASGGMDHDLKLAAIFGAVGIVGLIIGGNVMYVIGGIAMLIGVVFFVKWLIRQ